jgi:hypothetical protein
MIWDVSLSRMEFIPHTLTPELKRIGLRSLPDVGNLVGPLSQTVALRPKRTNLEAIPKYISERTRYLRACLAFHSYPQVIRPVFNLGRFGPPPGLTLASACPWIARSVSGLARMTVSPYSDSLSLRLRSSLNLATQV